MAEEVKAPESGKWWVTKPDAIAPIRMGQQGDDAEPLTLVTNLLRETVQRHGDRPAMVAADGRQFTWRQYYDECIKFAKSLIHMGFERHNAVNIIGFNSPEWVFADIGAIFAGGMAAGIYTTNAAEACQYIAQHSEAKVVVCEGIPQAQKFIEVQESLPELKALVVYNHNGAIPEDVRSACKVDIMTFAQFQELGREVPDERVEERSSAQQNNCCTVIYTSGTTGPPKAVMISHDNITWVTRRFINMVELTADEVLVSYLPLSHIAAQLLDIHFPMLIGCCVHFARPDALRGSLVQTLQAARPTIFFGVPRVWEKIMETMRARGASVKGLKRKLAQWAKKKGLAHSMSLQFGTDARAPGCYGCAHKVVLSKVHRALGLDRMRMAFTAAAPISRETLDYFASLSIHVYEIFGQSECTGPATANYPGTWKIGTCGVAVPGTTVKIAEGNGEIVYTGRHIFMGYMKMPEQTAETIDEEGYLHSGDVGELDRHGFLTITGRIKELIITAGGENIPPVLIEHEMKKEMPALSNVVVIGDRRKFLTMLVSLKTKVDLETQDPLDELDGDAARLSAELGSNATTMAAAATCPKWRQYITAGMQAANKRATSSAQRVQYWTMLPKDLSLPDGDLTPTLKLKRSVVQNKYAELIEGMYSGGGSAAGATKASAAASTGSGVTPTPTAAVEETKA